MEVVEDAVEGTTVRLDWDDDLADVPASHQSLLTPDIRAVFGKPRPFLERVRDHAPVPNMRTWFDRVIENGVGQLWLEVGDPPDVMRRAGFFLAEDSIRPAIVGLPKPFDASLYPGPLAEFYRLVGFVDWMCLMYAGKIDGPDDKPNPDSTLAYFRYDGSVVDAATTRIIGGSLCGDMMVCTTDGRGGWWNHETGKVALTGSIGDFLDWVFGELLADRSPESDAVYRKKK